MAEVLMVVAIVLCSLGLVFWANHRQELDPNCPICGGEHLDPLHPGWECRECGKEF